MVRGVVGGVGNDGVIDGGLSVYSGSDVCEGSVVVQSASSASTVNCNFGCRALKSSWIICMFVWLESKISKMSSTYRQ